MNDNELLKTDDAQVWASAFVNQARQIPPPIMTEEYMASWFAGAMTAAVDAYKVGERDRYLLKKYEELHNQGRLTFEQSKDYVQILQKQRMQDTPCEQLTAEQSAEIDNGYKLYNNRHD